MYRLQYSKGAFLSILDLDSLIVSGNNSSILKQFRSHFGSGGGATRIEDGHSDVIGEIAVTPAY
jgi:hypothetical protein